MIATTLVQGTVVSLAGRLDVLGARAAREALHAAVDGGEGRLVVDLAEVELLDATGLGVLVGTDRRARVAGRRLVLVNAPPRVARLLALTRVDRIIQVFRLGQEVILADEDRLTTTAP
jgi:anti-sigma B factor antagonist